MRADRPAGTAVDGNRRAGAGRSARVYLLVAFVLAVAGLGLIALANRRYAPEMYDSARLGLIADAFSNGQNYAVFDLNINIRELRDEQISRLSLTPSIVILGASQWQEASTDLLGNRHALNAHVHRDYYEDMLGMVEILARHDRLPRDLVITVRDRLFTPVAQRTDYLWLPGLPYYRAMARRLSLDAHPVWETQPLQRPRELLSLAMLFNNAARWHNASSRPHPTMAGRQQSLDLLLPDGSIRWSDEHQAVFTQERARKLAVGHADASRNRPPAIDPKGVEALDTLLSYLGVRGVRVHLAHPPFNPVFYDRVQDSPYMEGLRQVEGVTRELAAKHKLGLVGSFDPADLGCTAAMFIDAEHANASCLSQLMADIADSIDLPTIPLPTADMAALARVEVRSRRTLMASGWVARESLGAETAEMPPTPVARAEPEATPKPTSPGREIAAAPRVARAADATPAVPPAAEPRRTEPVQARRSVAPRPVARQGVRTAPRKATGVKHETATAQRGLVWPGDQPRAYR